MRASQSVAYLNKETHPTLETEEDWLLFLHLMISENLKTLRRKYLARYKKRDSQGAIT